MPTGKSVEPSSPELSKKSSGSKKGNQDAPHESSLGEGAIKNVHGSSQPMVESVSAPAHTSQTSDTISTPLEDAPGQSQPAVESAKSALHDSTVR